MKRMTGMLIIMGMIGGVAKAQSVTPGSELFQMLKIAETYRYVPNLSFDVQIRYTDSVAVDSVIDEMSGHYKLHGGLYYTYLDSTEIVQGKKYSLRVSHWDSVISIRDRQDYPDVMNMPVTDTLYWRTFTQSISVTNVNDSVRILKIWFKPGARYSSYEIRYNFKNYRMEQVKAYMPANTPGTDADLFPSGKALIKFTFSNYSTTPINGSWFSEDKFVVQQGGQFVARPDYTGYFIETNITQ
ncbi:MAG: hypothetical protein ACTHLE_00890 [Agriterribacter sp.]